MNRMVLSLVVVCLMASSFAFAQPTPPPPAPQPGKGVVTAAGGPNKAMLAQVLAAWGSMNTDAVMKYYDQAPGAVFYDVSPLKYEGFSQYVSGAKQMFQTLSALKFELNDDVAVHRAGSLAWTTATVKTAMTDKAGKTTNLDCRWTAIWQRKGANWVIVHDHFSAPAPPPGQ